MNHAPPAVERPRALGYVPGLSGVRGIAILTVVAYHFFGLPGGAYGVDVFFVLSGFLITTILLEDHERHGRIRLSRFYAHRARRLLPAMAAVLTAVLLIGLALFPAQTIVRVIVAGGFYAANVVRAAAPRMLTGTPLDHTWSLAEEEQFYLVWPLVLALQLRRRSARIVEGLTLLFAALVVYRLALVGAGTSMHRLYFGPDTHADGLVLGCAIAFVRRRGFIAASWIGWLAAATLAMLCALPLSDAWRAGIGLPLVELASAGLVLSAVSPGRPAELLAFRPLVWLGAISYSLYLWHMPMKWTFHVLGWPHAWLALPLSDLAAWLSYRLIEQPFRRPHARSQPVIETAPAAAR